jgi:hypothetical protein
MIATETARTLFGHASVTSVDLQAAPVYEFQIGADREARIVSLGVFLAFAELPTEIALADWKSVLLRPGGSATGNLDWGPARDALDAERGVDRSGGAQGGGSAPEALRRRATTLASSLRRLGETTPASFETDSSMLLRQADAFRQLSARPVVDTKWIVDYDRELDETVHSLDHERAMTNAAEAEFLGQAQKNQRIRLWVERMDATMPLLLLSTILCMGLLKREMRLQLSHPHEDRDGASAGAKLSGEPHSDAYGRVAVRDDGTDAGGTTEPGRN